MWIKNTTKGMGSMVFAEDKKNIFEEFIKDWGLNVVIEDIKLLEK